MRKLGVAISTLLGFLGLSSAEAQPVGVKRTAVRSTMEIRTKLLEGKSKDYGIAVVGQHQIWAVVMDQGGEPNGSFSVVALADGNASVYVSSGGGVIGGYAHENVRKAAIEFVSIVNSLSRNLTHVSVYPVPKVNVATFYAISDGGVSTFSGPIDALQIPTHRMNPAYYSAHVVMSELRKISERVK